MNLKAIEIQIYFEIAMAIGTSLDLEMNLKKALSAYLRKLSCSSGMILQLHREGERFHYTPCFSIPRNAIKSATHVSLLEYLPPSFTSAELDRFITSMPMQGTVGDKLCFAICSLPDFGFLVLTKSENPLKITTLHSLHQLNKKLADSCISCLQKRELDSINTRLSHEIEQRKEAEAKLQTLLTDLESKVTERTRALEESRYRYKTIFDNIQDIYFSLDLDGKIIDISPSVEKILQFPRERLIGHSIGFFRFPPETVQSLKQAMLSEGKVTDLELEILGRDRFVYYFSMNAVITRDAMASASQIVGSLRDITRQHLAEESKKELENQLLNSKKMEALGLLAGGVAHDLNNVLSGIVSYPDLLLSRLKETDPLTQPIRTIRDSGEKAAAIVQDLLTMARRGVPQKEIFNVNSVIETYLTSPEFAKLSKSHPGLRVICDLHPDLLNVIGSPLHIKTTIMNMVHNSAEAKATILSIFTGNTYLEGKQARSLNIREGEYIRLTLTDNGIGLSSEDQQRIFEPFYTKKVMGQSGTGLGMAVVWGTILDHQGHITIDSDKGSGTTFNIYLPGTRQMMQQKQEDTSLDTYLAHGETIVVVDDNQEQRYIAQAILEALNYKVYAVDSGEAILEMTTTISPDLILLDMIMENGMDGLETYRRLRNRKPDQKVVIVSGYSESDRVQEALRLGALMYIRKPYLLNTFGKALRKCLD